MSKRAPIPLLPKLYACTPRPYLVWECGILQTPRCAPNRLSFLWNCWRLAGCIQKGPPAARRAADKNVERITAASRAASASHPRKSIKKTEAKSAQKNRKIDCRHPIGPTLGHPRDPKAGCEFSFFIWFFFLGRKKNLRPL